MSKLFNDLDDIYKNGIQERDGAYVCSVCGKQYKRSASAEKHVERQDCHTYKNLFKGSPAEEYFYDVYRILCSLENKRGYKKAKFITSQYYTHIAKFYVFCFNHNIRDMNSYLEFILGNSSWKNIYIGLSNGLKESVLKKYNKHQTKNVTDDDSEKFYNQHQEYIEKNTTFALRSLEKGSISMECLFEHIDVDKFIDDLSPVETRRFRSFILALEGRA